jgi:hypothetical protein
MIVERKLPDLMSLVREARRAKIMHYINFLSFSTSVSLLIVIKHSRVKVNNGDV